MSVATEFPPAVFVPVRARSGARAVGSPATSAPGPRLRLVPPVDGCPPSSRRRVDGARRGVGPVRRPAACPASSGQPAVAALPTETAVAQAQARPVRLTRRGVVVSALGVALAGGLLLLVAHLSAGAPATRPAVAPSAVVTVQPGDTLWSIAGQVAPGRDPRRVVEQIRRSNHLDSVSLMPGQTLKVG